MHVVLAAFESAERFLTLRIKEREQPQTQPTSDRRCQAEPGTSGGTDAVR